MSAAITDRTANSELRAALEWIAQQEDYTFAECSLAEEIISRAKAALAMEPTEPLDPEPHEGHRACQKRFAGDAHTIANMGGMLNEAEALLRDWLAQTNATLGDTIQRTYKWGRRWAEMRDAPLPK